MNIQSFLLFIFHCISCPKFQISKKIKYLLGKPIAILLIHFVGIWPYNHNINQRLKFACRISFDFISSIHQYQILILQHYSEKD